VTSNDSGSVTLTGTASAINAALATTNYTGNSGFSGTDHLVVTTTDGGGNTSGPQTVAIAVTATGAPTLTAPPTLMVNEDGTVALGISETPLNPNDTVSIDITGVPSDATLSAGTNNGNGS